MDELKGRPSSSHSRARSCCRGSCCRDRSPFNTIIIFTLAISIMGGCVVVAWGTLTAWGSKGVSSTSTDHTTRSGGVSHPQVPRTSLRTLLLAPDYTKHTRVSLEVLQDDYSPETGLWNSTGWWNSANCLTMVTNYAIAHGNVSTRIEQIIKHTHANASGNAPVALRKLVGGVPTTLSLLGGREQPTGFLNGFYDDEGWWALAWIRAFDLTRNATYLSTAASIFDDMIKGHTAPCGGMWWNKAHDGEVAITNSLFIQTAAALANRAAFLPIYYSNAGFSTHYYRLWAVSSWTWFNVSGMINDRNLVNDGLDAATCSNNGNTIWSYNQGAIIGALVELFGVEADPALLDRAASIANAAIKELTDRNGIMHDICEPDCGFDGTQFKGIFVRALADLHAVRPDPQLAKFMRQNANSILRYNRNEKGEMSINWAGPFINPANASTHCSAMDALVAVLGLPK